MTSLTTERDKLKEELAAVKRRGEESPARVILTNAELKGKVSAHNTFITLSQSKEGGGYLTGMSRVGSDEPKCTEN